MFQGHRLEAVLDHQHAVGGRQGVGVLQIDLVLTRGHLMVARLHLKAHGVEVQRSLLPDYLPWVQRELVEIVTRIRGAVRRPPVLVELEQEELVLWTGIVDIAHPPGPFHLPLQDVTGVPGEPLAAVIVDAAHHARSLQFAGGPGVDLECTEIGMGPQIALLDGRITDDGGTVEKNPIIQRLLQLGSGDRDRLHRSEDVHELHLDELDLFCLRPLQDLCLRVFVRHLHPGGALKKEP